MPSIRPSHRGKGSRNSRKGPKFAQSRLRHSEEPFAETNEEHLEGKEEKIPSQTESESEIESTKEPRPYNILLQTFNIDIDHHERRRKRRKITHPKPLDANQKEDTQERDRDSEFEEEVEDADEDAARGQEDEQDDTHESDEEDAKADSFQQHFDNLDERFLELRISNASKLGWTHRKQPFGKGLKCTQFTPTNSSSERPSHLADITALLSSSIKHRFVESSKKIVESLE
jgi:hypothetical protein